MQFIEQLRIVNMVEESQKYELTVTIGVAKLIFDALQEGAGGVKFIDVKGDPHTVLFEDLDYMDILCVDGRGEK